jgi:hypothetical protein
MTGVLQGTHLVMEAVTVVVCPGIGVTDLVGLGGRCVVMTVLFGGWCGGAVGWQPPLQDVTVIVLVV